MLHHIATLTRDLGSGPSESEQTMEARVFEHPTGSQAWILYTLRAKTQYGVPLPAHHLISGPYSEPGSVWVQSLRNSPSPFTLAGKQ